MEGIEKIIVNSNEKEFLDYITGKWEHIFMINGNHEFYVHHQHGEEPATMNKLLAIQKDFLTGYPNVHLLENEVIDYAGVRIIGSTLWSYVPEAARPDVRMFIRDYSAIFVPRTGTDTSGVRFITTTETNALHEKAVRYIHEELAIAAREHKTVLVMTHHAPLMRGTSDPAYENVKGRAINHAFATDLSALIKPPVHTWVFGHTHWTADFRFGETRILANPRGYGNTSSECRYDPKKIVEL